MNRWWIYQRERFPLAVHAPLIAAFSLGAVGYSACLRGTTDWPPLASLAVAFFVSLGSFFLLRVADEFKDAEEDARFRPYRPVPRGLVTLRELGWLGGGVAVGQLVLTLLLSPPLLGLLALTWLYFALMSREFFVGDWLRARPVLYLFSHMLIMPMIDWYATGCDWVPAGQGMPDGLGWFLAASFCNGLVIELGRKLRAPSQEEPGVSTYTALWGRPRATAAWGAALVASYACAGFAALPLHRTGSVLGGLGLLIGAALVLALAFVRQPTPRRARNLEALSAVWTLTLYALLGILPLYTGP